MKKHKVVVVHDDAITLMCLSKYLPYEGYEIEAFANPILAWEFVKENHKYTSLVLTDYKMPGMSGFELCEKIIDEYQLPCIVMTAYDAMKIKIQMQEKGYFLDVIQVPAGLEYIAEKIAKGIMRNEKNNKKQKAAFIM